MRPLEAILLAAVFIVLAARWLHPRTRQTTATLLAMLGIFLALHLFLDGPRWEMTPAYLLLGAAALVFGGDLRRMSEARAGESARWRALPSPARRMASGAALVIMGAAGVCLAWWLFPRVLFPELDGAYDVGRVHAFWVDSAREETFTPQPGDRRGVWVTVWYPAESPSSTPLRYHPDPGALAADLGQRFSYPALIFRNLARARTNSTLGPRFSIREGRSPLLLFLHGDGETSVQSTYECEALASHGYVVVSVEHTYGAIGTTLPDGARALFLAGAVARTDTGRARLMDLWVADEQFVLNRLQALPAHDMIDSLAGHLEFDRVGAFGYSLGGGATPVLMSRDSRVKAGIDMDGIPGGAVADSGIRRPFLVFTSREPDGAGAGAPAMRERGGADSLRAWFQQRDARIATLLRFGGTEVHMEGARQASFTDLPLWSPPLARRGGLAGSDAARAVHGGVTALTVRFFDQYLKNKTAETEVALPASVHLRIIRHEARPN